jgi:primase-polymerase (primpol)-like protein
VFLPPWRSISIIIICSPKTNSKSDSATFPKPEPLAVNPDSIPGVLQSIGQWVVWKYVWNPDKKRKDGGGEKGDWDKPLYNARTGRHASSTDPATWCDFETVLAAYRNGGWDGIGFALTENLGIVGIDLDHCRDRKAETIERRSQKIIKVVRSYTEVSPSGTGLRIIERLSLADV